MFLYLPYSFHYRNLSFEVYIHRNVSHSIFIQSCSSKDISTCTAVFMYLNLGYEIFSYYKTPCLRLALARKTRHGWPGSCCKFGVMATEIAVNHLAINANQFISYFTEKHCLNNKDSLVISVHANNCAVLRASYETQKCTFWFLNFKFARPCIILQFK